MSNDSRHRIYVDRRKKGTQDNLVNGLEIVNSWFSELSPATTAGSWDAPVGWAPPTDQRSFGGRCPPYLAP
jgi:hypothetical protein